MQRENMRLPLFMFLVDSQCHSREYSSTVFITGYSSHYLTESSSTFSPTDIPTRPLLFILCLFSGLSLSFVISNAIWSFQVSEKTKKKVTNTKTPQKREEFHTAGDSIWFHVRTTFGKLWAG